MKKNWRWYGLAILLLLCDQFSKWMVLHSLDAYQSIPVFPGLNWTLVFNSGSAFGFLNQSGVDWYAYGFTAFGVLMAVVLVIWMARCQATETLELLALACILSGALGNVLDRIQYGYVIDFIQVHYGEHYFPVFNLADSAITLGAIVLFFANRKQPRRAELL